MKRKMKMIAVLNVEFDLNDMIDLASLNKEWGGNVLGFMKWLYSEEDIGIFENKIKLVDIKGV